MAKTYSVDELFKLLKKYDEKFEFYTNKGKGSHRTIYHPAINGEEKSFPIKYHGGSTDVRQGTLSAIKRRFGLPNDLFQ